MSDDKKKEKTRGQAARDDVSALLRSKHVVLWVMTREEERAKGGVVEAANRAKFDQVWEWDCVVGLRAVGGGSNPVPRTDDPAAALDKVRDDRTRRVYVFRDLHKWVLDPIVQRRLRNLALTLESAPPNEARAVVVLTPSAEVPPELAGHVTVVDWPLPDRAEVAALLDETLSAIPEKDGKGEPLRAAVASDLEGKKDAAVDAAVGLSRQEAANCYALSLAKSRRVDPVMVAAEKRRVIAREKVITWYEPDPRGLDAVGGYKYLKEFAVQRRMAFSARARAFGLPAPKGMLLVGPPGCGKSLTAKCLASAWGVPLLRLDLGALRSKYVGESENNLRRAQQLAEAISPCVLWMDEVEKALGSAGAPQGDGGVSADALGSMLSWMQEKKGSVFIVATANDVRGLPPEFLRKGRFDEVFWLDLPTEEERVEVLVAALREVKRDPATVDLAAVARECRGFTGAEVAALVPDALFRAFAEDERAVTTGDLLAAAKTVTPIGVTAAEKIQLLREWAKGRARPASEPERADEGTGRNVELDTESN